KKRIPHVEGQNFTPNEVRQLFIAWSIPNEPQNSLNLVNKVCSFIKGILGLPTEFSVVSPMILRLIEYSAIIINIPDSNGLIFPFVCNRPVRQPAKKPTTKAANVATSG